MHLPGQAAESVLDEMDESGLEGDEEDEEHASSFLEEDAEDEESILRQPGYSPMHLIFSSLRIIYVRGNHWLQIFSRFKERFHKSLLFFPLPRFLIDYPAAHSAVDVVMQPVSDGEKNSWQHGSEARYDE